MLKVMLNMAARDLLEWPLDNYMEFKSNSYQKLLITRHTIDNITTANTVP